MNGRLTNGLNVTSGGGGDRTRYILLAKQDRCLSRLPPFLMSV